jgi:ribulose-phosphate 3-epimerase
LARFLCAADMQQIDPLNLATCIRNLETQGADELHFDVADGRFISQFGFSTDMIAAAKAVTALPCHAHLRIEQPERMLDSVLDTGVDIVTLHVETSDHIHRALSVIRDAGRKVGLALAPATPLTKLSYCLPQIDRLVVLATESASTTSPMPRGAFERIRILSENIRYNEYAVEIDAEGPHSAEDGARCVRFGAKRLVLSPEAVSGLAGDDAEALGRFRHDVEAAAHTV